MNDLIMLRRLGNYREFGVLLLRLFAAFVLIYGTQDNVFHRERMLEFRDFLKTNNFPAPLFNAYLSAYAQFICGILIGLGLLTRLAAMIMVINFVVALVMVHWGLPYSANIPPLAMLFISIFFMLNGGGRFAVDSTRERTVERI